MKYSSLEKIKKLVFNLVAEVEASRKDAISK